MPTRHATGSTNMASDEPGDVDVSGFADYERYDALGLAELVRRRRVSPGELLGPPSSGSRRATPRSTP